MPARDGGEAERGVCIVCMRVYCHRANSCSAPAAVSLLCFGQIVAPTWQIHPQTGEALCCCAAIGIWVFTSGRIEPFRVVVVVVVISVEAARQQLAAGCYSLVVSLIRICMHANARRAGGVCVCGHWAVCIFFCTPDGKLSVPPARRVLCWYFPDGSHFVVVVASFVFAIHFFLFSQEY